MKLAPFLYNRLINGYSLAIKLASPFHAKAQKLKKGHSGLIRFIEKELAMETAPRIWVHCASLGEFEQGRPLMEAFKKEHPHFKIVLTFFSPSGYEVRKNYSGADYIFYLPYDTPSNARRFLQAVKPELALFVKYEFWYNYLIDLQRYAIPTFLVSGFFFPSMWLFKENMGFYRQSLSLFQHHFVQNRESLQLLQNIGIKNASISGDTRFDRVAALSRSIRRIPLAEAFKQQWPLLVVGSSWKPDLEIIAPLLRNYKGKLRSIVAPHEVDEVHLKEAESQLVGLKVVRFSKADRATVQEADVLLIDNVGMLSSLYALADYAYVGGGLGKGLHNTLEAATFGIPIFFGNRAYQKYQEARDLLNAGAAFAVGETDELQEQFKLLYQDRELRQKAASASKAYVEKNTGATEQIMRYLNSIINKRHAGKSI